MALLYPFLTTEEGIKINVLGKDILFKLILPPIPKDIYSLNNISIIKEIDKEKIDRKSGFQQVQIDEKDKYKTAFTIPFGYYKWNVMPFGLKMHLVNFKT